MKVKKVLCYILYTIFAKHLPCIKNTSKGFFQRIRYGLVKGYIEHCGKSVNIQPGATIARRVSIGDESGIGKKSMVQGNVKIGSHVMMGPEVYIFTQNHSFDRTDITMDAQGFQEESPVIIEDDVWIGARATILGGVSVGKGSIIGTSAVVTKSVPPYSIVVGNPARVIKTRTTFNK